MNINGMNQTAASLLAMAVPGKIRTIVKGKLLILSPSEYFQQSNRGKRAALRMHGICLNYRTDKARPGKTKCQPCVEAQKAKRAS